MPTLEEKNDRLESVPNAFVKSMEGIQDKVSAEIDNIISQLDMKDGNILLTEKNMSLIESANQKIKDLIFDEVYEKDLTKFLGEFKTQADLSNKYFQSFMPDFEPSPVYKSILESTQRNALELLSEDAFTQAVIVPIKQTLESSITNNISFSDTVKNLRYIIEGDENVDGKILSHVKRVAYDSFTIADRSYTNTVAQDLGLEFYRYAGGKIEDTRCFCLERAGKYFHKKEIQGWGRGEGVGSCGFPWQGMNSNTDEATIFFYAGGYNCRHALNPVAEKSVPQEVKDRARSKGYIK